MKRKGQKLHKEFLGTRIFFIPLSFIQLMLILVALQGDRG